MNISFFLTKRPHYLTSGPIFFLLSLEFKRADKAELDQISKRGNPNEENFVKKKRKKYRHKNSKVDRDDLKFSKENKETESNFSTSEENEPEVTFLTSTKGYPELENSGKRRRLIHQNENLTLMGENLRLKKFQRDKQFFGLEKGENSEWEVNSQKPKRGNSEEENFENKKSYNVKKCAKCGETFCNLEDLQIHFSLVHGMKNESQIKLVRKENEIVLP